MLDRTETLESNEPGYKPQCWRSALSSPRLGALGEVNDITHIECRAHSEHLRNAVLLPLPQFHLPQIAQSCFPPLFTPLLYIPEPFCLLYAASLYLQILCLAIVLSSLNMCLVSPITLIPWGLD